MHVLIKDLIQHEKLPIGPLVQTWLIFGLHHGNLWFSDMLQKIHSVQGYINY